MESGETRGGCNGRNVKHCIQSPSSHMSHIYLLMSDAEYINHSESIAFSAMGDIKFISVVTDDDQSNVMLRGPGFKICKRPGAH